MGIGSDASAGEVGPDSAPAEYERRLATRQADADVRSRRAMWTSNLRLAVFAAGVIVAWMVFATRSLEPRWLAPPVLGFGALLVIHDRLLSRRDRALRSVAFYQRGLDRLRDAWAGGGERGERFRNAKHLYAEDLDLIGEGSLFELLCSARTVAGEDTLADWLLHPAEPDTIRERQAAVSELRDRLDLREDLARLGDDVRAGLHPEALRAWGRAPAVLAGPAPAAIAAGLALLSVSTLTLWIATPLGGIPFLVTFAVAAIWFSTIRRRVFAVVRAVETPARDLALFSEMLERLEEESYQSKRLAELRAALDTAGAPPSVQIARLRRLIDLVDASRNQLFLPIALLVLWTPQLACAIDRWRMRCGPALERWIDSVGEFEALSAFAGFAFENPDHPFPEIVDEGPVLDAIGLGHPLLPSSRCVRNDVRLVEPLQALIVSGSNMSGKSTLMRTLGTNVVLALAGAPVRAERLRVSPLAIGASIRIQDSLQEGSSRFYAEILRLRDIAELARGATPALFLLDEILHGTNSHDRGIGAEAVVRYLVDAGAIGLVTTHDLALTRLADAQGTRVDNVHFEDHLEGGVIAFDYRMRPGVVEKSNALELMRAVGLDV
jgi:hypothetical protein